MAAVWKFFTHTFVGGSCCFLIIAAGISSLIGCGAAPGENAAAKFRPVDEGANKQVAKAEVSGERSSARAVREPVIDEPEPTPPRSKRAQVGPATDTGSAPNEAAADAPPKAAKRPPISKSLGRAAAEKGKQGDPALAGPTAEKVEMMRKLATPQPLGKTEQQKLQSVQNQLSARLQLAEEILVDEQSPEAARIEALEARLHVYSIFVAMDMDGARDKFVAAAQDLAAVPDPERAIVGKAQLFMYDVGNIFDSKPRDGATVVKAIEEMLESDDDYMVVLKATAMAAQQLAQAGFTDDAAKAQELIGDHFEHSETPQIAIMAAQLQLSSLLLHLRDAKDDDRENVGNQVVAKLQSMIEQAKANEGLFDMLQEVAIMLESIHTNTATKMYDLIDQHYSHHQNSKVADRASQAVENGRKHLALVGQPFEVDGVLLSGKPFNWSALKGKVVLVDFWATWCGPCLQEMPNIIKSYNTFHDQGFEVVGVNLDDKVETVKEFFADQSLPWPTVVSVADEKRGFSNPNAVKCGVDSIPFVVLVGRDGKVAQIHVRGAKLEGAIKELLAKGDAPADGAEPPATGAVRGRQNPLR